MEVFLDAVLASVGLTVLLFPRLWTWQYKKAKSEEIRQLERSIRFLKQERNMLDLANAQRREGKRAPEELLAEGEERR
jgi:hypothetical protein